MMALLKELMRKSVPSHSMSISLLTERRHTTLRGGSILQLYLR